MRLTPDSGTLLMRGRAHWLRGAFMDTTLADDIVTLLRAEDCVLIKGSNGMKMKVVLEAIRSTFV